VREPLGNLGVLLFGLRHLAVPPTSGLPAAACCQSWRQQSARSPKLTSLWGFAVLTHCVLCVRARSRVWQAILSVCDSALSRAVRATIFVTSMADAAALLSIWREAAGDHGRGSGDDERTDAARSSVSFVEVASLPRGALVEFQVSALNKLAPGNSKVRIRVAAAAPRPCRCVLPPATVSRVVWDQLCRCRVATWHLPHACSVSSCSCNPGSCSRRC